MKKEVKTLEERNLLVTLEVKESIEKGGGSRQPTGNEPETTREQTKSSPNHHSPERKVDGSHQKVERKQR